jgi:hypothetical protein
MDFDSARKCPTCDADLMTSLEDAVDEEKRQGHQAVRVWCPSGCWNVRCALPGGSQAFRSTADMVMDRIGASPLQVTGEITDVADLAAETEPAE